MKNTLLPLDHPHLSNHLRDITLDGEFANHDLEDDVEHDDVEVVFPANDNAARKRRQRCPGASDVRGPDVLLALAGYDPTHIPSERRAGALLVAWCFQRGLFGNGNIAQALKMPRADVANLTVFLRKAAKPGTRVG